MVVAGCDGFARSLASARVQDEPYRHWILQNVLPAPMAAALDALPFPAPALDGLSGSREIHNNTRTYVDAAAIAEHPMCDALAQAFQHPDTVATIEALTGARLDGCCLRIEYAQDTEGFWLQPHTDLGVKKFTLLYYLGPAGQPDLGTDVYSDGETWSHRAEFEVGGALAFVPSDRTWHGFEPRPIPVVRKTLIINYVTAEWMAREQLAYPDRPVAGRRAG
ncbi:MAG TPA: hypothetical protein VFE10_03455 [Phenylobacterium sp.]|jgi:hypothetical protein|nr:hypothetical protein [Phenylobacterium sp.]